MNIDHLRSFIQVYESKSISQAATACYMPQQALSRLIKSMETSLSVQLFRRSAKGVSPTEYGELLYKYAKKIIANYDQALSSINALKQRSANALSVGVITGAFHLHSALPPRLFAAFMELHPDCTINIRELSCADCIVGVLDGSLDMAYVVNVQEMPALHNTLLTEEPPYVVFSSHYKLAERMPLQLSDFRDVVLLYHKNNPLPYSEIERAFRSVDFVPEALPICESIGEMAEWTRLGKGIMLAGRTAFSTVNLDGMTMTPFPDQSFTHVHSIITSKEKRLSPTAKLLLEFLEKNRQDLA